MINNPDKSKEPVREIVIPGEELESVGKFRPGMGTYARGGKIYSAVLGIKSIRSNYINIIPLSGCYQPRERDLIIGKVIEISASSWMVDINSPYPALLHVSEVPWKIEFGDTQRIKCERSKEH